MTFGSEARRRLWAFVSGILGASSVCGESVGVG